MSLDPVDLKPENILMDQKGRTRLSDLGLAVTVSRRGITGTCGSRGYWYVSTT